MGKTEQKHNAIEWLWQQSKNYKGRPCSFTPTQVAKAIDGGCTTIGKIQGEIIAELRARGLEVEYIFRGNQRFFQLY